MNKLVLGAVAALIAGGMAYAADVLPVLAGNTMVTKDANGESKTVINADKTYTSTDAKGVKTMGAVSEEGGKVCFTPAGKAKNCTADFAGHKVGDSFEVKMDDGTKYPVKLVAGH